MLFPTVNFLYFYVITLQSMCTVPCMAVFCSSLILCFPSMLFRYFLNDFEMVTVAPFTTYITFFLHSIYAVCTRWFKYDRDKL
jgi:hypothetical protein